MTYIVVLITSIHEEKIQIWFEFECECEDISNELC